MEPKRIEEERDRPPDSSTIRAQRAFVDLLSRDPATANGNLDVVARLVTEFSARLLGTERSGVWLFDDTETQLRCVDLFSLGSGRHSSGETLLEHEFRPEFQALKSSLYVDASFPLTDPRTAGYVAGYLQPNGITSMLDAVIRFGGRNLGVLCLEHVNEPHVWKQHEIDFACLVGSQLSVLIERRAVHRAESARRETLEQLEARLELDRLKSRFFANISHEFRTPLTLLLGPVEDLLSSADAGEAPTPRQREQLEVVHRNASRLLTLVSSLLDFVRFESGRVQATFVPTDLAELTREVTCEFLTVAAAAGLALRIACDPVPEPAYVDRAMWEKTLLNLISNAIKFTLEGAVDVRLRVDGATFELVVEDSGVGIPPESLPHVFERFYRVPDSRGRSAEGSGIGLALVREIALMHGGAVDVESTPGVGSCFRVKIPRGKAHLPADQVRESPPPVRRHTAPVVEAVRGWVGARVDGGQPAAAADRPRVLVVDDNADMRAYMTRLLAERYDVEAAGDGFEALAAVRTRRPDLILSDVMMSRLDGIGLVRALRADESTATLPVLLLSARAGEEALLEGLAVGADDYIAKPFSSRELLARVDTHIELAHTRQEAAESRLKDVFLKIVAHELKTPLSALKLRLEYAKSKLERAGDPSAARQLASVQGPVERMERLVRDMVDVSAIRSGELPMRREACDLVVVCRDAVTVIEALYGRPVLCALPGAPVPALADRERIGEAVENLLSNAMKFSPAGRPVSLSLDTTNDCATIEVRDEGPGIPAEELPHLFERFHRVPGIPVQAGSRVGFGLGLHITRAIVEQHGGRVDVETKVGRGTTFRLTLPASAQGA
jgi:signal transduction histidine kinase